MAANTPVDDNGNIIDDNNNGGLVPIAMVAIVVANARIAIAMVRMAANTPVDDGDIIDDNNKNDNGNIIDDNNKNVGLVAIAMVANAVAIDMVSVTYGGMAALSSRGGFS